MNIKTFYLSNGEEVELLSKYKVDGKTRYVVGEIENPYPTEKIVFKLYKKYEETPMFLKKTELEKIVKKLETSIKKLEEDKEKLNKKVKSVYNPRFSIGDVVFSALYGRDVEELKVEKIVFTEYKDRSTHRYYCDKLYREFTIEDIGKIYFLNRKEAEKAKEKYLREVEQRKKKEIIEKYKKVREEYLKLKEKK